MSSFSCRICGGTTAKVETTGVRDWEYGVEGEWSLLRCDGCGVVQIHPFPSLGELKDAYEVDYHGFAPSAAKGMIYETLYACSNALFRRSMRRLLLSGSRVLDVGCGSGEFLSKLQAIGIRNIDGLDFSETAVKLAASRGLKVFHGLFVDFEMPNGSYDAIFMNNYLEHTIDPVAELTKARRLLTPTGKLLGEVPNFDSTERRVSGKYWGGNHAPRHTFHFDRRSLTALLAKCGFSRCDISYPLNTSHMALSVQNAMQRTQGDLRHNSRLRHGRAQYYGALLIAALPVHAALASRGKSGLMDFVAMPQSAALE